MIKLLSSEWGAAGERKLTVHCVPHTARDHWINVSAGWIHVNMTQVLYIKSRPKSSIYKGVLCWIKQFKCYSVCCISRTAHNTCSRCLWYIRCNNNNPLFSAAEIQSCVCVCVPDSPDSQRHLQDEQHVTSQRHRQTLMRSLPQRWFRFRV